MTRTVTVTVLQVILIQQLLEVSTSCSTLQVVAQFQVELEVLLVLLVLPVPDASDAIDRT